MAERTLAEMMYDYERTLEEYTKGNVDIDVVVEKFDYLRTGVAGIVSRYCDDFSSYDYHKELISLREANKEDRDDQSI